ncbi:hypothetical protein [Alkalinema sp. FACHB-956]|uniref:hypothetical protein n=1 Tax=Alkalinema sp. FACHB-956 TaxID=2692768 RepID=UPI001686B5EA|nr:hypothetical protein [Alkalinema sp. FACHB-956]MBD2325414.1 hypothetical protein [Alkalinema sp. FACHB-956]
MSSFDSSLDATRQQLKAVRNLMLKLHKALLDSEKAVYEQTNGRIANNMEFFKLVLEHEHFAWLRVMSKYIVEIDEAMAAKEPVEIDVLAALLDKATAMLQPNPMGDLLSQRYYAAIERDPVISKMHVEATTLFRGDA